MSPLAFCPRVAGLCPSTLDPCPPGPRPYNMNPRPLDALLSLPLGVHQCRSAPEWTRPHLEISAFLSFPPLLSPLTLPARPSFSRLWPLQHNLPASVWCPGQPFCPWPGAVWLWAGRGPAPGGVPAFWVGRASGSAGPQLATQELQPAGAPHCKRPGNMGAPQQLVLVLTDRHPQKGNLEPAGSPGLLGAHLMAGGGSEVVTTCLQPTQPRLGRPVVLGDGHLCSSADRHGSLPARTPQALGKFLGTCGCICVPQSYQKSCSPSSSCVTRTRGPED